MTRYTEIISWNIWQMDGLTQRVPFRKVKSIQEIQEDARLFIEDEESQLQPAFDQNGQGMLFVNEEETIINKEEVILAEMPLCKIANWENTTKGQPEVVLFKDLEKN